MNRRDTLLALLTVGVAFAPRIARPQTASRIPTLGFLSFRPTPSKDEWDRLPFAIKLKELGWIEGKNILIERAFADGRSDRLPALAADLVRKQVDVIYAFGPDMATAAARATKTIPIVFWGVVWPIEQGLVDSYARPGRNVTGIMWNAGTEVYIKQLEFVRQISPAATRIAFFSVPNTTRKVNGESFSEMERDTTSAAKSLGFEQRGFPVTKREDFDIAFKAIQAWRAQALITSTAPLTALERQSIVNFANANRIPSFFDWRQFAEDGGLFSYGPEFGAMTAQAVRHVDRILRGANPADLPVEMPTRYELVINRKTAKALGITISQELLYRADQVID